jgi:CRISPR-associated endoribonuclease Cas6
MRVHITFTPTADFGQMPINYNTFVSQFVYELIQPDVPFNSGRANGPNDGIPYYTFSNLYIPEVQQQDRTLHFAKVPIELTISMLVDPSNEQEVLARMNLIPHLEFDGGVGTTLLIDHINVLDEAKTLTHRARFRMLSPLASPLWESPDGREQHYVHYNDQEFSETIRSILVAKYERWRGKRLQDSRLTFCLDQKYVQRRRGRISKLVTFHEGETDEKKIKAIVAPFEVEGNPELIWLGYVAGFGERNLLGFGCSDLVTVAPMGRKPAFESGGYRANEGRSNGDRSQGDRPSGDRPNGDYRGAPRNNNYSEQRSNDGPRRFSGRPNEYSR